MKSTLRAVAMAFQMFSRVPMPNVSWEKENLRYMLAALPAVGLAIGAALWGWYALCAALRVGRTLYAAGLTLLPLLISGGIHMDGFCDTSDALASHADPERRREILKDSHAGAFAVMAAGGFLLLHFALCAQLEFGPRGALALGIFQVLSRAIGAIAALSFPGSGKGGLLASFTQAADKRARGAVLLWAALCVAALALLSPAQGALALVVGALCLAYLRRMAARAFGGMSGDLAGYLITLSQLALALAYVLMERLALL